MNDIPRRLGAYPADGCLRSQLLERIEQLGLDELARHLLMSAATLARIVAGGSVRDGTVELARARLHALPAEAPAQSRLRLVPPPCPEPLGSILGRVLADIPTDGNDEGSAA